MRLWLRDRRLSPVCAESAIWGLGVRSCDVPYLRGLCGVPQDGHDGVNRVELAGGDADYQVVGLVVGQGEPAAVEAVERDDRGEREPLVTVDERAVAGDGVQQLPIGKAGVTRDSRRRPERCGLRQCFWSFAVAWSPSNTRS